MALTKAQLAWCAAVFTAGTVTPPAVQKANAYVAKAKGPGKAAAPRAVVSPETVRPAPQPIKDCPLPSVGGFDETLEYRLDPIWANPFPPLFDTGGGIWAGGGSPAAVPAPDTWVMLVAGFGLVGLSMRKRKHRPSAMNQ